MATLPTVYDTQIDSGTLYRPSFELESIQFLDVPSSRYVYLSGNNLVPMPSIFTGSTSKDLNQTKKDVEAWINPGAYSNLSYAKSVIPSEGVEADIFAIQNGQRVAYDRYLNRDMLDVFETLRTQGFSPDLRLDNDFVEKLYMYPLNPASNMIEASQLAVSHDPVLIEAYLRARGIIGLNPQNIARSSPLDIFFYLTRFYGPPRTGNLDTQAILLNFKLNSMNAVTKNLADKIETNYESYKQNQANFGIFFRALNENPNTDLTNSFGSPNQARILASFFSYLELFTPTIKGPLTLITIKQLNTVNVASITNLLRKYTDDVIIRLVGTSINAEPTRELFLRAAADILATQQAYLLEPLEARLCQNKESVVTLTEFSDYDEVFLGKGALSAGLECYGIDDLIQTWTNHTDATGKITFINPAQNGATFTLNDVKILRNAVNSGRANSDNNPNIRQYRAAFENFVIQYELQQSADYNKLQIIRQWANQNDQNKDIIRQLFTQYFYMGMYMRQWKGPGNPYPIQQGQTGREAGLNGAGQAITGNDAMLLQISQNVATTRIEFERLINQIPEPVRSQIWDLTGYLLEADGLVSTRVNIRQRWNDVFVNGNYCIRMASAPWSYTGAYYLDKILGETIPGFNLNVPIVFIY